MESKTNKAVNDSIRAALGYTSTAPQAEVRTTPLGNAGNGRYVPMDTPASRVSFNDVIRVASKLDAAWVRLK